MAAKLDLSNDIYYSDEYISLYLKDDDELFSFKYEEGNNLFINKTIKRPIKKIANININDGYFDLESAYGYGGYYTNCDDKEFIANAMNAYYAKCNEEKVIAEFIRFHPFNTFPAEHQTYLDFNVHDRDVVIFNLDKDILSSYPSKIRNTIKRATEKVIFQESKNIEKFIDIYTITMKKNYADDFYLFDKVFFEKLFTLKDVKLYEILFEDQVIAMGFFMFGQDLVHYHLSANTDLSYKLNSNYALLNNLFLLAQRLDKKYFVLGGGTTSDIDDPLLKFKKKFSKELKAFYISGNVFNQKVYDKYNAIWLEQSSHDIKYFLKYRVEI